MRNPNSLTARLRWKLAKALEPQPDAGEAWCIRCELGGGRTAILSADSAVSHARAHRDSTPPGHAGQVTIVSKIRLPAPRD